MCLSRQQNVYENSKLEDTIKMKATTTIFDVPAAIKCTFIFLVMAYEE